MIIECQSNAYGVQTSTQRAKIFFGLSQFDAVIWQLHWALHVRTLPQLIQ